MSMAERVRVSKGVGEYVCGFGQLSECEDVCVCLGCVYGFLGACVCLWVFACSPDTQRRKHSKPED